MGNIKVLLIEDDAIDRMAFKRLVVKENLSYDYTLTGSISEARRILSSDPIDIIIADYFLGDGTAFDILEMDIETPIIITTGAGNEEIAVRAMKAGAYDYLIKDPERNYLKILPVTIGKAIRQKKVEDRCRILTDKESEETVIIGGSGFAETLRLIELASSSDMPVLITGETGTGKNLVAKAIHYRGGELRAPFISINCAALPENLIEAELFGYEKGAFTGAIAAKKGIFEMAEEGTLFLDEIAEMPFHLQTKLLNVTEDKKVRRLGGESTRAVNARIISATSIDLENSLSKTFRKDLFYRLSVIRIHLPSLRERRSDIPELTKYLLKRITDRHDMELSGVELEKLMAYDWPGNVRELKNVLERAYLFQKGSELHPSEFLGKEVGEEESSHQGLSGDNSLMTMNEMERRHIRQALARLSGNVTKTAEALGISLSTLKRKIRMYGLKRA